MREAYSRLSFLLDERGMTRADLQRRLRVQGDSVDAKALNRLANPDRPIKQVDTRIVDAICRALGIELGDLLAFTEPLAMQLKKLPDDKQRRLDELMDRHTEEELRGRDLAELQQLVDEVGRIGIFNAERMLEHRQQVREARSASGHSGAERRRV